jgi:hypothetical protein
MHELRIEMHQQRCWRCHEDRSPTCTCAASFASNGQCYCSPFPVRLFVKHDCNPQWSTPQNGDSVLCVHAGPPGQFASMRTYLNALLTRPGGQPGWVGGLYDSRCSSFVSECLLLELGRLQQPSTFNCPQVAPLSSPHSRERASWPSRREFSRQSAPQLHQ